ncbi:MAG TPA: hypothetical protein VF142_00095 [Longimicrobium sp.]
MADVNAPPPGRAARGTNLLLVLLVVVVLALVAWLVLNRGASSDIDVNVEAPAVETPDVEVRQSGDGT